MENSQFSNRNQMIAWIKNNWQNHLKYMVYNNPQEVINILSDDYDIDDSIDYSETEIETLAFDIANSCEDSEAFTRTLSDIMIHDSKQEGWANILNYSN